MKKLLIAVLALFIVNSAIAQSIRGGIKVGGNLSTITNIPPDDGGTNADGSINNKTDSKMKFGFHIGGFIDFAFSERVSLQSELLYSAHGTKITEKRWNDEGNVRIRTYSTTLGYINVPVLFKVNITEGLSAEIGPQIGFLLSAEQNSSKVKQWFNTLDITAIAGLSYAFAEDFVVSARYGLGLTYIHEVLAMKNSVIQLSVGYKF